MESENRTNQPDWPAAAVLAAGAGSRFGGAKLLARLGGRPLIQRPVEAALQAGMDPVWVVTGFHARELARALPEHPRLRLIHNPNPEQGMAGSLALAARAAQAAGAPVLTVLLGDMPLISPELIARTARAALDSEAGAAAVRRSGRPWSHPTAFTRRHYPALMQLEGDVGGRGLLASLGPRLVLVPGGEDASLDVDTPADLERASRWLQGDRGAAPRRAT